MLLYSRRHRTVSRRHSTRNLLTEGSKTSLHLRSSTIRISSRLHHLTRNRNISKFTSLHTIRRSRELILRLGAKIAKETLYSITSISSSLRNRGTHLVHSGRSSRSRSTTNRLGISELLLQTASLLTFKLHCVSILNHSKNHLHLITNYMLNTNTT